MSQVNTPYSLPKIRPIKLMAQNMPRDFFESLNNYFEQSEKILQQLYLRSGGTADNTADESLDFNAAEIAAMLDDLSASVNDINAMHSDDEESQAIFQEPKQLNYYSISADRTTLSDEFIRATAACEITLNAYPNDGETVKVQPTGSFVVTITGAINGDSSLIMNGAYDLAELVYSLDAGEWVIT